MKQKRKMPTKRQIKVFWSDYLTKAEWYHNASPKFDSVSELFEDDYCFQCGFKHTLYRCHITARCNGGSDEVWNIHLLCEICHRISEFKEDYEYDEWFFGAPKIGNITTAAWTASAHD